MGTGEADGVTIIAYRAGILAADSAVYAGGRLAGAIKKLARNANGGIAGAAVPHVVCYKFRAWFVGDRAAEFVPGIDDFGAIIVESDGCVWRMDHHGVVYPSPAADYHVEGSAEDIAAAAMEFGASAIEVVEVACRIHGFCCGPVQVERLRPAPILVEKGTRVFPAAGSWMGE